VNANVRDSYQLEPAMIEIKNPKWQAQLNVLVRRVATELGCYGSVEAKLYKLLIYKQGGHFLKHRDTEKEKSMFATLVIQLPSVHEGGELVVYENNGKSKKFDFGHSTGLAPYAAHYAAHYADMEHELLGVKSGYRLALVYSLCWIDGNGFCPNKDNLVEKAAQIVSTLGDLNCHSIAISLEHKYTPESFKTNGLKALKSVDNERYCLLKACNELLPAEKQVQLFALHSTLVIEAYDVTGNDYMRDPREGEWEENERHLTFNGWYGSNSRLFKHIDISDFGFFTNVIDVKKSDDLDLEDEDEWGSDMEEEFDGYTGNEGATLNTTYHKYFLVMLSANKLFYRFLKIDPLSAIDHLYENHTKQVNEAELIENFKALLPTLKDFLKKHSSDISTFSSYRMSDERTLNVVYMKKLTFLLNAIKNADVEKLFNEHIIKGCKFEADATTVVNLLSKFDWKKIRSRVLENITSHDQIRSTEIAKVLLLIFLLFIYVFFFFLFNIRFSSYSNIYLKVG
jgi:hypothetical protein